MLLLELKRWWWSRRRAAAEWDVTYFRSGVVYFQAMQRKAEERLRRIDLDKVELEFPAPSGVTRREGNGKAA